DKAAAYYRSALDMGSTAGALRLGDLAVRTSDVTTGLAFYQQALDLGDRGGAMRLGDIYSRGELVKADRKRAIALYSLGGDVVPDGDGTEDRCDEPAGNDLQDEKQADDRQRAYRQ